MRHSRPLGVLAAVAKGLFLLWAVPAHGTQPPSLQQIHALVRHMAEDAQELFVLYEQEQHLAFNLCRPNTSLEWLRGTLVSGTGGLRALHRAMVHMDRALQDIARHQSDLSPPGAPILQRLSSARLKVRGLLSNLEGFLQARGLSPAAVPPARPMAATGVFQQKLEGCRVLWSYTRFLARLSAQLQAQGVRARREEREWRRGGRRGRRLRKP